MRNKQVFEASGVVKRYSAQQDLQAPEEVILNALRSQLAEMSMLDIGVGGGRTTYHFGRLAKKYVGIDYSVSMIDVCKRKFAAGTADVSFEVCDATSMPTFSSDQFDFVLFSFNGIDMLSHDDRLKALKRIRYVCKTGGCFCFSAHNLQSIDKLFRPQLSRNPIRLLWQIYNSILLRMLNQNVAELKKQKYAIINVKVGSTRFRLKTYYIRPEEQIKQLRSVGFKNIRLFSLADGQEIKEESSLRADTDEWIYYLCSPAKD